MVMSWRDENLSRTPPGDCNHTVGVPTAVNRRCTGAPKKRAAARDAEGALPRAPPAARAGCCRAPRRRGPRRRTRGPRPRRACSPTVARASESPPSRRGAAAEATRVRSGGRHVGRAPSDRA
eukprot:4954918-Prymnesium_polylepis.1